MNLAVVERINYHDNTGEVFSTDLEYLRTTEDAYLHLRQPISFGGWKEILLDEAKQITGECSEVGWDGYDALPITEDALDRAILLINLLPDSVPHPDLVPSPDGMIGFDWYAGPSQTLSVTPYPDFLVFAAMLGENGTRFGKIRLTETSPWPEEILYLLTRYLKDA